ncbi:cbb3-type cytochrome oxidase assembly protein CcoS [Kordiimonas lipolytica]|uniref:Cbb3-type cytochrome oxidase assembly protein CcoS n=1 Tax=Kordiimonas lipolytica TaxID=1662421 RepID=A0ABV8UE98_9PROT|nr:cbb3-type cytochrome oxidase assembly protein CcoS [Kordiimonas lipolytica]
MDILLYLIPIALTLGLAGLAGFLWSLRNNQYDDLEGAAHRILLDDDEDEADEMSHPK